MTILIALSIGACVGLLAAALACAASKADR